MKPTVVILGASGRLGRRLVPSFAAAGFDTIGVARTWAQVGRPVPNRWVIGDLTTPEERLRVAATIAGCIAEDGQLCVVDVVLDRRSVDAMRHSLQGVTDAVLELRERLRSRTRGMMLIAGSTTAVLAPSLYQTPYGLAKRRQVITYAHSGMAGAAVLLPALSEQVGMDTSSPRRQVWSFDRAALRLVAAASGAASGRGFAIHVPDLAPAQAAGNRAAPTVSAGAIALAHLQSLVTDRGSMQAHRDAARGRLRLLPKRLRRRIDHHMAPAELVSRFAARYRVTMVDERTAGSQLSGEEPQRA